MRDIRGHRSRSNGRMRDIRVIGAGVMAAIGVAKIGKLGGVWGAASPPIIAPPTGISPKTPSGVTGAGIAGLLRERLPKVVESRWRREKPGTQLSIELPPANPQEELPKVE